MVVNNPNGTAPGLIMEKDQKCMILLPGPPGELVPMFEESIVPYLKALQPGVIFSKTVKVCGIGESQAETMAKDLIGAQTNPTIATYAKTGEVHFRVTALADAKEEAKRMTKPVVEELKKRFGSHVYTSKKVTLERAVVKLLQKEKLTVATAESCTGGMLAARLINVSGVSESLKVSYITYSDKAKRNILGVKKGTLEEFGAVSSEAAEEMAKGAAISANADVAVATTGIAGPKGGSGQKPVGLVYIACNVKGKIRVEKYQFSGSRMKVRENAVASALTLMRKCILEYRETAKDE